MRMRGRGIALGLLLLGLSVALLWAQVPNLTVKVQWDPNPPSENVTSYTLVVDGGAPLTILSAACSLTVCEQVVTLTFAPHTFSLTATNAWGVSPPATLTADLSIPGSPTNLRMVR